MALENIKRKIAAKEDVVIGYFGGSITEGAGVKDGVGSWRNLTAQWFSKKYPEVNVTSVNAAIGGTGSALGLFRAKRDLLSHNPDLVFVEYAVNDYYSDAQETAHFMEGIVRLILSHDPNTDIVFVYTATKNMHDDKKAGKMWGSVDAHNKVAEHYGIECIDVGCTIIEKVDAGEGDWNTYTTDTVHPNAEGYKMYADKVIEGIEKLLADGKCVRFAEPMYEDSFIDVDMIDMCSLGGDFKAVESSFCGRYPRYAQAQGRGETVTAEIECSCLGLYYVIGKDTGDIAVSIDGAEPEIIRMWDHYALDFDRAGYSVVKYDMPEGKHTIKITSIGTKDEQSLGTYARIACILSAKRAR